MVFVSRNADVIFCKLDVPVLDSKDQTFTGRLSSVMITKPLMRRFASNWSGGHDERALTVPK